MGGPAGLIGGGYRLCRESPLSRAQRCDSRCALRGAWGSELLLLAFNLEEAQAREAGSPALRIEAQEFRVAVRQFPDS